MSEIKISIIVPVYNRPDCVRKCIESVSNQLLPPGYEREILKMIELIIVDDGSTDNTLDVVKSYEPVIPYLKIIHYKPNKGVNFARNRGVEASKGQFVLFLDSDEILTPGAVTLFLQTIEKFASQYDHFLFDIDYNVNTEEQSPAIYTYPDWLSNKVKGDYAHLILKKYLLKIPFNENFRIYESLTWFQIFKLNKQQLHVPELVKMAEFKRFDSVSKEYLLQNKKSMKQHFMWGYQYTQLYGNDLIKYNLDKELFHHLKKTILVGVAIGNIKENKLLIRELKKINSLQGTLYNFFNLKLFSPVFYFLIKMKSKYGNRS